MAVVIRLSKFGKRNAPSYRIVVTTKKTSRQGRAIELIGSYNPSQKKAPTILKKDRLTYWQEKGAKPSAAVQKIINGQYQFKKYQPGQLKVKKD